ncbi:MAG: NADH-quinone oxidoreductase subunit N, partial [Gammaproteobacteria bacterium]|nr:NADH-quinone oxidoreductase subunit N [Gammaproteobacteria bacterium]
MNPASISKLDLVLAAPEIFLLAATCVVLLGDLFLRDKDRWITFALSLLTLAGVAWVTSVTGFDDRTVGWHGTYVSDPLSTLLKVVACGAVAVAFLYGHNYLQVRRILKGEYYVLGLFALLGIMVLVSANSLVTLYLGVELLALSLYALVAFDRDSGVAAESAIKYFVLGSIASGALLYGMSIVYGVTGSLELGVVRNAALQMEAGQIGLLFGLAFIVVGVAFKFGAVPFHTWVPDVYHGAPTPVTLFLAAAPKLGSFALAFRLLAEGLGPVHDTGWQDMITMVAVASIAVGNVVAIAQTNIKRMLAYSTISHVGFILLGILAGTSEGYEAALYYTITYVIMSVGGFGMVILLSRQ